MSFLADLTVEIVAEIKKPYPKLHFSQLFAFLTKIFWRRFCVLCLLHETTKRDLGIVDGPEFKKVTNEKFLSHFFHI